jgi:uncharacterized protein (TIGR03084 family)
MVELADILADLDAESAEVDGYVADLPPSEWALPTPAEGWTIAHQIAHLAWTDEATLLAIQDPDGFIPRMISALEEPSTFVDRGTQDFLDEPAPLLHKWRSGRAALRDALAQVPPGTKIPWYGTAMSPVSMVTARIMETWAHGLDIADALGRTRTPTARLRHVAHLGHRTLGYSFMSHDKQPPTVPVYLSLTAPDGTLWTYGPEDAENRVDGPALDFCLLVTQRRNRADLALVATGPVADEWLDVAQAFAGPSGSGREPDPQGAAHAGLT